MGYETNLHLNTIKDAVMFIHSMSNRLVFLDIDGVLNQLQPGYYIDKKCVQALSTITHNVVLVSTWKKGWSMDYNRCLPQVQDLVSVLGKYGIAIDGRTRDRRYRDEECRLYMKEHGMSSRYIILDDDISLYNDKTHLYIVDSRFGFTGLKKCREGRFTRN